MGKIHVSEDLKCKLDKVLSVKKIDNQPNETAIGPAPKWKNEIMANSVINPLEEIILPKLNLIKEPINNEKKNNIFNYFEWAKIVFFTSFIGGIGLTFGIKIGRIIFY